MADGDKSAAPEVDSQGLTVGGDIKAIYSIVEMGYADQSDGAILVQAKTKCGRTITCLKEPAFEKKPVLYGVNISKPDSTDTERGYQGIEGSDACRVFGGYLQAWEKCVPVDSDAS